MPAAAGLALVLTLAGDGSAAGTGASARCLPAGEGHLSLRLRGSIEEDLDWREPALSCTGMSRPDGRGLRLRFAGPLAGGGELAVVIAAPELGRGASGRGVPVNLTLIDGRAGRIYGTQGDAHCALDEVTQQAIDEDAVPPGSYRVAASGYCVAPARALDGDGAVLATRFDFAGRVTFGEEGGADAPEMPEHFAKLERAEVEVIAGGESHAFDVWVAADGPSRERGLMRVRALPPGRGMLFVFARPQPAAFWMKDTWIPLDMVFIGPDGVVDHVAESTRPHSLEPVESRGPVIAVLEVPAGTARGIGLAAGDRVVLPTLRTTVRP